MLDSPYVRRVAVSLRLMDLPFTHEAVSVFRHFDRFAGINPVVKAPTLVTDDGIVLMESTLILEHAEKLVAPARSLQPAGIAEHARGQRIIGLALAACEKAVQIVYERELRPSDKQHQLWVDRVDGQLAAALRLLEAELAGRDGWLFGARPMQPDATAAVAWTFIRHMVPNHLAEGAHPALAAHTARAEALDAFAAYPHEG